MTRSRSRVSDGARKGALYKLGTECATSKVKGTRRIHKVGAGMWMMESFLQNMSQ